MLTKQQLRRLRAERGDPNRVQVAMDLLDLTQVQLSEAIAVPQSNISRIVNGHMPRIPVETARKFAEHFGCAIEDLFPSSEAVAS